MSIKVNYGKVKKDKYGRSISIDVNGITFEVDSVDPENPLVVDPESGNIIGDLLPSGKVRCSKYEMLIPEVPKGTSFFSQQAGSEENNN